MMLDLRSPLFYIKIEKLPSSISEYDEVVCCYELNPAQGCRIDPQQDELIGHLMFAGKKATEPLCASFPVVSGDSSLQDESSNVSLPARHYLFMQCRADAPLCKEEWLDMAIEQQKDGLWERHKLENLLYVRYLHEDKQFVTQVFRPVAV
jgi:hypothetical protein